MLKDEFKKKNITITNLSEIMNVSRPTLYKLIEIYNKDKFIPPKYKDFLDAINNVDLSPEDTLEKLIELKKENKKSKRDSTKNKRLLLANIVENAKKDLNTPNSNQEVYKFINYLITNYKKNNSLVMLSRFVLFVNNIIDDTNIDDNEMKLYSAVYKSLLEYKEGNLEIDEKYYDKMQEDINNLGDKRKIELEKAQEELEKELRKKLKLKILHEMNKKISLGIDLDDLDLDDIAKNINFD